MGFESFFAAATMKGEIMKRKYTLSLRNGKRDTNVHVIASDPDSIALLEEGARDGTALIVTRSMPVHVCPTPEPAPPAIHLHLPPGATGECSSVDGVFSLRVGTIEHDPKDRDDSAKKQADLFRMFCGVPMGYGDRS
jgi:hypothetical protein